MDFWPLPEKIPGRKLERHSRDEKLTEDKKEIRDFLVTKGQLTLCNSAIVKDCGTLPRGMVQSVFDAVRKRCRKCMNVSGQCFVDKSFCVKVLQLSLYITDIKA